MLWRANHAATPPESREVGNEWGWLTGALRQGVSDAQLARVSWITTAQGSSLEERWISATSAPLIGVILACQSGRNPAAERAEIVDIFDSLLPTWPIVCAAPVSPNSLTSLRARRSERLSPIGNT